MGRATAPAQCPSWADSTREAAPADVFGIGPRQSQHYAAGNVAVPGAFAKLLRLYFSRADGNPITVAGLWEEWRNTETGEPLKSCTMIITDANAFTRPVHSRMPLELESFAPWLSGKPGRIS